MPCTVARNGTTPLKRTQPRVQTGTGPTGHPLPFPQADPLHLSNRNLPITSYGLLEATAAGYCSVVRRLIADGANPNIPGKENPLLLAARAQAGPMVQLLLDSKCSPNVQDNSG